MATLFMSMSGEGRGHATRALSLIEALHGRHRVFVFAPGDAYALLAPLRRRLGIEVEEIPGIRNVYSHDARWDHGRTILAGLRYRRDLPALIARLSERVRSEKPDLIVSDFEPALPRTARRMGIPYVTVDHQQYLLVNDLSSLPCGLRVHAAYMGLFVRAVVGEPAARVVSSFFRPPLKPRYRDVAQVGVLLRPAVRDARATVGDHVVAYLRRMAPPALLDALSRTGVRTVVYGLGRRQPVRNLEFARVDDLAFADSLAGARALISTAGNQIVGEAIHLRKPVFAMPEPNNYEQRINAHFVERMGIGRGVPVERVTPRDLSRFLARAESYTPRPDPRATDGTPTAVAAIEAQVA